MNNVFNVLKKKIKRLLKQIFVMFVFRFWFINTQRSLYIKRGWQFSDNDRCIYRFIHNFLL